MIVLLARTARTLVVSAIITGLMLGAAAGQNTDQPADGKAAIEIRIKSRKVVGDNVIRLTHGQEVKIIWTTDEAAELHIHGYDIRFEVSPDAPAEISFQAHATGRFAVTSHGFGDDHGHGHETLVYIEVYPD